MMLQPSAAKADASLQGEVRSASGFGNSEMAPPLLLQYWQLAMRWKWVIIGIIIASLIAGLVATTLMTPEYTAASRIEISRDQKNVTKVDGVDDGATGRDVEFYATQWELLESRTLAERVARSLKLADNAAFFASHGTTPDDTSDLFDTRNLPVSADQRTKREKKAIAILEKHVGIAPIRGSSLVDIRYRSASPTFARDISNAWTQEFIQTSLDRRLESTGQARKYLEDKLAELKEKVELSERALVNYASQKGIVSLSKSQGSDGKTQTERTLISNDLEALNDALAKATADRIIAESRARGAQSGGASAEALGNVAISQLRQKRAEVAAEYAKLMVQFEPGYPAARALSEQIRVLDNSISREESRVGSSRTSEFREALQRETQLSGRVEQLKARLDLEQRDNIQYKIYQREADRNSQLYDSILQRYKEIGVAGVGTNNISIVDPAQIPDKPSAPSLTTNLALALIAGIGLALLATLALNQIDEGLREPGQVNRLLQLPLLGSVPDVEEKDTLDMLGDAKSLLSEAYLSIRSNLAFSTDHGVPKSFMVTSTRPAEGKSTTSLALAIVLARTGKRVILIDADMRSPSIHGFLDLGNKEGLSNYLAGEDDWKRLVGPTKIKNLQLLPAGPTPPSAAELLSSDRMLNLVQSALAHCDHVVIDSAPILGLADAPLLSRAVEGCVFVAEAEGVAVRGIKAALSRLHSVQAHIFGAVLTKLNSRQAGYGYGYGYGDGYGENQKG
jgi:polysaccharide biosynthesis transport protein